MKRSSLIRAILRKSGQRRRNWDPERPYLTRQELLKVNGHLDMVEEALGRKDKKTRGR